MPSGPDPLSNHSSFAARRPNASSLPNFELPHPQLSNPNHKFQSFSGGHGSQPTSTSATATPNLASVGNLLTPPTNLSGEGINSVSSGVSTAGISSTHSCAPYSPGGYGWQQQNQQNPPYGYQAHPPPNHVSYPPPPRNLITPTIDTLSRGGNSPGIPEGLPPPPYEMMHSQYPSSGSMPAPSIPTMSSHQQHHQHHQQQQQQQQQQVMTMMRTPVSASSTLSSPVHTQDGYQGGQQQQHRPSHTPSYYSQNSNTTPQQTNFPYSSGPSPTAQSPMSAGPLSSSARMSPPHSAGPVPNGPVQSPHPYQQRPYGSFSLPGPSPVMSGVPNPGGHMALVGGMPNGGMIPIGYGAGGPGPGPAMQHHHFYGNGNPHHSHAHHHHHAGAPTQVANERPFKCDQCPQSFNRNHDLKRHKRIHLAVKPFPCGHCDKSFSRKDALKV